jgi:HKD family nuclease
LFYNQPLATRFGTELLQQVDPSIAPYWDTLDIAVAWVRASGMAHLNHRFTEFLQHGGQLCFVVGIDLKSTTREGLQALLDLEQFGNSETFVYHNESGSIFHPKLYLFRNGQEARLIVGSNNLTQAGLFVNVEAGLQVDTRVTAPLVRQALDALATWKDTTSHLAFRLDATLLAKLMEDNYVIDERASREMIRQEQAQRTARNKPALFGNKRFSAPLVPGAIPVPRTPGKKAVATDAAAPAKTTAKAVAQPIQTRTPSTGDTVIMRLRVARGTQTQIPMRLTSTFFANDRAVTSNRSGEVHGINVAMARGNPNTMKLELPETLNLRQPMARFERTPQGIVYDVYDLGTPSGNQIMAALEEGRRDNTTQMTISNPQRATWWRFI